MNKLLLGIKSLDSIQSTFLKTVQDLKDLQNYNNDEIVKRQNEIEKLKEEANAMREESLKADRFQQNIQKLLD